MSVYVHLSLLIHQMNQSAPRRMWRFAWCPSPGGATSAAPPPGDRWLGPLFVVGYPVLAQQWDELFCVFVGEVYSGAVDGVDGNRRGDEAGGRSVRLTAAAGTGAGSESASTSAPTSAPGCWSTCGPGRRWHARM